MSASQSFAPLPAILGKGVIVMGEVHSREPLIIEGEVEGSIHMPDHLLTIAADGRVHANVKAREIDVHGALNGQAEAKEKMRIRNGAEFIGDIHSASIAIDEGGFMKGSVDLSKPR